MQPCRSADHLPHARSSQPKYRSRGLEPITTSWDGSGHADLIKPGHCCGDLGNVSSVGCDQAVRGPGSGFAEHWLIIDLN